MSRPRKALDTSKLTSAALLGENAILAGVDESVRAVVEQGRLVQLKIRQVIYEPEQTITDVFFPLEAVLSIVTNLEDGHQIEIGTVGREGMSALPLLMGASSTANDCYCQVPGRAIKIPTSLFRKLSAEKRVRQRLDRYLQAYMNMLGQLAACNRLHSVAQRAARWLLLTNDRVGFNEIPLTHEYLAMMLGTGRSDVTIAAALLQKAGFIKYAHGKITILDRPGLEAVSCECYKVAQDQFGGLLRLIEK